MIGFIGDSFLGERIFYVAKQSPKTWFSTNLPQLALIKETKSFLNVIVEEVDEGFNTSNQSSLIAVKIKEIHENSINSN
jgi:hypothetical protein